MKSKPGVFHPVPSVMKRKLHFFADYFLNHWPNLHVFGMTEHAWEYLGNMNKAAYYGKKLRTEKMKLTLHNRRHWFKNANLRFMNWDEYTEHKRTVFPQIQQT